MKVILQKDVQALGKVGDVVEASAGYFRNFLQPRSLAILASTGALKKREEDLEQIKKKADAQHQLAVALSERITALGTIRIIAKAGDGGRLYGKVTNKEIAQALSQAVEQEIDKRSFKTVDDITALGTYRTTVRLASEVVAELNVEVLSQAGADAADAAGAAKAADAANADATDAEAADEANAVGASA